MVQVIQIGRAGRKRKHGRRKPSGDLAASRTDNRKLVMNQPHRKTLENKLDQRAETPFGRMNIYRIISDDEYYAGKLYARIVGRYRAVIEAPKASASSCGLMVASGPEMAVGAFIEDEEAQRRKHQYDRVYEALMAGAGQRASRAVAHVAVYGEPCPPEIMPDLKRGLATLESFFGLTTSRKSAGVRGKFICRTAS